MRSLFRLLGLLIVFFLGMAVWVLLLPLPHGIGSHASMSATAAALPAIDDPSAPQRKVRVVYADATTDPKAIVSPKIATRIDPAVATTASTRASSRADAAEVLPRSEAGPPRLTKAERAGSSTEQAMSPAAPQGLSVNLNTASIELLNQIPGGGSIGRRIVAHRPYKSVNDLLSKRVVRRSVFDRIRQQVAAE